MVTEGGVHEKLTIVDGLIFWSDGTSDNLRRGNVAAANVTVCGFQSDFLRACDELAGWRYNLSRADSCWHLVCSVDDIDTAKRKHKVGLIMGIQNLRPLEDKLERLALFHAAGIRIMQLTYNERNFVGDGCLEESQGGLSEFGKRAIDEMNRLHIAIDLSHVGERTCLEAIECSRAPVLITHANAKAILDVPRNKSDRVLKEVAARGGTIGASIHLFMCWDGNPARRHSLSDFVRHINYLRDLVGIGSIAMGTDFPSVSDAASVTSVLNSTGVRYPSILGRYSAAFGNSLSSRYPEDCNSPADLPRLTDALLASGWSEDDLRAFYGGNIMRSLRTIWHEA
jgi:membrane dipeptidase